MSQTHDESKDSTSNTDPSSAADPMQMLKDFLQDVNATEKTKEWAAHATEYIKANPWVAVAGAAAIGYVIGNLTSKSNR